MHFECTIIKSQNFKDEEEKIILDTFKKQAGKDCVVTLKYVSEFPALKSGKKQYFCTS